MPTPMQTIKIKNHHLLATERSASLLAWSRATSDGPLAPNHLLDGMVLM